MAGRKQRPPEQVAWSVAYGALVRRLRASEHGQNEFADYVGISRPTWSRVERGMSTVSLSEARTVAWALRVSMLDVEQMTDAVANRMQRFASMALGAHPDGVRPWSFILERIGRRGLVHLAAFLVSTMDEVK